MQLTEVAYLISSTILNYCYELPRLPFCGVNPLQRHSIPMPSGCFYSFSRDASARSGTSEEEEEEEEIEGRDGLRSEIKIITSLTSITYE